MGCSCPLVMSEPIYLGNLEDYQKCGGACSLHHTDPAILGHQSAKAHRSHLHWHPWTGPLVGSIWLLPVFSPLTGTYDAFRLHLTQWQLNSHPNLLHQGILARKVVSLLPTWHQPCLHGASAQPPHASPRPSLVCASILAFWNQWGSAYQLQ